MSIFNLLSRTLVISRWYLEIFSTYFICDYSDFGIYDDFKIFLFEVKF